MSRTGSSPLVSRSKTTSRCEVALLIPRRYHEANRYSKRRRREPLSAGECSGRFPLLKEPGLIMEPQNALVFLNAARRNIERANSVQELKGYRDQAEAIRQYAKQRGASLAILNGAAEVKLRAERRMGELLEDGIQRGGDPKSHGVTLADLGIAKMESSRWQAEAAVPEPRFEEFLAAQREAGEEITQAGLLRVAKELRRVDIWDERQRLALELPERHYQVILADPPWQFRNTGLRGVAAGHYPTMPIEEIAALPVADYADVNSVLFLWASNALLPEALQVLVSWGFEYKSKMTWVKNAPGPGFYLLSQDEPLLIGVRGSMMPKEIFSSVIHARKGRHSEKPTEFYERIEAMYPGLKRLELFARSKRDGWHAWGNEVEGLVNDVAADPS